MFVAQLWPALLAHRLDRPLIQPPCSVSDTGRNCTAQRDRARSSLLEAGFVEKGIGIGVHQFVRKHRWYRSVDGQTTYAAVLDVAQNVSQSFKIHRFLQHILHHLVDQRMVGNLNVADDGFKARCSLRKYAGHEVFRARALYLGSDPLPLGKTQQLQAASCRPPPSRLEDRGGDRCLFEQLFRGLLVQELEDVHQCKTVLLGERDIDAVVGRSCLKFKIEAAAEPFAQGKAPRLVNTSSERRMQDKLHASALVEESLSNNSDLGRNCAQYSPACNNVVDQLQSAGFAYLAFF